MKRRYQSLLRKPVISWRLSSRRTLKENLKNPKKKIQVENIKTGDTERNTERNPKRKPKGNTEIRIKRVT